MMFNRLLHLAQGVAMVAALTLTVAMIALLSGCATVGVDYCDVTGAARCALEASLEAELNRQLEALGSPALVDVVISCPDGATCAPPPPPPSADEQGDWRTVEVAIRGR